MSFLSSRSGPASKGEPQPSTQAYRLLIVVGCRELTPSVRSFSAQVHRCWRFLAGSEAFAAFAEIRDLRQCLRRAIDRCGH